MSIGYNSFAALLALSAGLGTALPSAGQESLDATSAATIFAEADRLASRDSGALWGVPLHGPMLLVRQGDRLVYANRPAPGLRSDGAVFTGTLPDSLGIANTAVTFADTSWTMLMWPLPSDLTARRALVAHELWHRVQDDIGFPMTGAETLHLARRDGRFYLRLEWRALAAAMQAIDAELESAVSDALLFRRLRFDAFESAEESERGLLMHEGLAEYTGWALSGAGPDQIRQRTADRLREAEGMDTFVRSFAYYSGPAWGLVLDRIDPTWRERTRPEQDLGAMVTDLLNWSPPRDPLEVAFRRFQRYDGEALAREEDLLARERAERRAAQRVRYVEGPVLKLDFRRMRVSFDPGTVDALGDLGRIYGSMEVSDAWGTLRVTGGGLILSDWSGAVVPAPGDPESSPLTGDGYVLELNEGWRLEPGARQGDWVVRESAR